MQYGNANGRERIQWEYRKPFRVDASDYGHTISLYFGSFRIILRHRAADAAG